MTDSQHDEIERLTNLCYEYLGELTALRAAKQTQDMMRDALTIGSAWVRDGKRLEPTSVYTTPPAAQRQHVTDGSLCWCDPETSYTDPETGASVVVHKGPQ